MKIQLTAVNIAEDPGFIEWLRFFGHKVEAGPEPGHYVGGRFVAADDNAFLQECVIGYQQAVERSGGS